MKTGQASDESQISSASIQRGIREFTLMEQYELVAGKLLKLSKNITAGNLEEIRKLSEMKHIILDKLIVSLQSK